MRILIGCESSGAVRREMRKLGHDAFSCDFLPAEDDSRYHIQGDVRSALKTQRWDMFICFPTCTYVCGSGLHWNKRDASRAAKTEEAIEFFRELLGANVERIALENPIGILSTRVRKPDQIIQPYQFGEDASKATCLWLKGLPLLWHTNRVRGRMVTWQGKLVERWSNQTDSGQNKLTPSADRWRERSRTYPGIARAMASQWASDHLI